MGRHSRASWSLASLIGRNLLAFVIFWCIDFALVQIGYRTLGGWPAFEVGQRVACVVGVTIALGMRAAVMAYFLAAMAAFSASELAIHLYYGIRAAQGAATHFAVMGAGILGVALGALLMMRSHRTHGVGAVTVDRGRSHGPAAADGDGSETPKSERRSNLALQPAGARS